MEQNGGESSRVPSVITVFAVILVMLIIYTEGLSFLTCIIGDGLGVTQAGADPDLTIPDRCVFGNPITPLTFRLFICRISKDGVTCLTRM